jgi:hypothetical protein
MSCKQCADNNQREFSTEIAIHFPGLEGLKKPIVWVFPRVGVCLNCGFAEFGIPQRELTVLREGKLVNGSVVSDLETQGAAA